MLPKTVEVCFGISCPTCFWTTPKTRGRRSEGLTGDVGRAEDAVLRQVPAGYEVEEAARELLRVREGIHLDPGEREV